MSAALRVLLLIGALAVLMFVVKSIRKSRIQMKDALTWMLIALLIAVFGIFPNHRSLSVLFVSYPVSWILTIVLQVVCFYFVRKRVHQKEKRLL